MTFFFCFQFSHDFIKSISLNVDRKFVTTYAVFVDEVVNVILVLHRNDVIPASCRASSRSSK